MEESIQQNLIMYPAKWVEGKPLVSIIAVCHNHARFVVETLDSIRLQTYQNIELIIINNLKDECETIIREWIELHQVNCLFIQNEVPKNVSRNFNLGLSVLHGEYFQGLSCDDLIIKSKIENQINLFLKLSFKVALIHNDAIEIDVKGKKLRRHTDGLYRSIIGSNFKSVFALFYIINTPTVLIKTKAVREIGGYDDDLVVEDYYLFSRLLEKHKSKYTRDIVALRRVHTDNLSHNTDLFNYRMLVIEKLSKLRYSDEARELLQFRIAARKVMDMDFKTRIYFIFENIRLSRYLFWWFNIPSVLLG